MNLYSSETLRLVWPQWQGAATPNYPALFDDLPVDQARRGYVWGTRVLEAFLPPHNGPVAHIDVPMDIPSDQRTNGIENKPIIMDQLRQALDTLDRHHPQRVMTIGGDCAVSVAPFAYLKELYGDDCGVLWLDAHPDVGTSDSDYPGYHAMAVSVICGHGDTDIQAMLPATYDGNDVLLAGLHSWTEDDYPHLAQWGIQSFTPNDVTKAPEKIVEELRARGFSKLAVHCDVDVIDAKQIGLGLGLEPDGITSHAAKNFLQILDKEFDVVGLTLAEFIPRNLMILNDIFSSLSLVDPLRDESR